MNNLSTRKIVLGMLLAFVLAFGVQGIAEAQTITVTSGNNQTKKVGETFSITLRFTNVTANTDTSDPTDGIDDVYQVDVSFNAGLTLTTTSSIVDVGGVKNLRIANPVATSTYTYTLTYKVNTGTGAEELIASGLGNATVYIVPDSDIAATEPTLAVGTAGYRTAVGMIQINGGTPDLLGTVEDHKPLRYSVSSGGTLYVPDGTTNGRTISSSQTISSSAPVWLRMNSGTRVVSVYVEGHGSARSARTTIIFRYPRLSRVSGHTPKQVGAPGSRLLHPFTVQVRDGGSGTGRPVPGQVVTFVTTNSAAEFSAHTNFPDIATATTPIPAGSPQTDLSTSQTANVTTDSSGDASVFLVLGDTAGEHTVTARVGPATTPAALQVEFKADAVSASAARSITKVADTDGQHADSFGNLEKALTVVVRDQGGSPKQGETVTFNDRSGGALSNALADDPGDATSAQEASTSVRIRETTTDANGEASMRYTAREEGGVHKVAASINPTGIGYREVIFTINGSAPPPPRDDRDDEDDEDDEDDTTTGRTITINPPSLSLTGRPGVVVPLGVLARTGTIDTPVTVTGNAAFIRAGGTVTGTGAIRDVTLPSTVGTYSLTVSATGYDERTVSVTVTGTAPSPSPGGTGRLSIRLAGSRSGTQQQIRVTVQNSDLTSFAGALNVPLTGATNPSFVSTLNGIGSVVVTLPTATSAHTLTVSAPGFGEDSVTVPAVSGQGGSEQPSGPTPRGPAGAPSSIRIASEPFPSGTANRQLAQPLSARVLDANGNGVANVRVTFKVVSGQGRLSQRGDGQGIRALTDRNGNARATYMPLADGTSTVRATAAGVTQTVTFTITAGAAAPSPDETTPSDTGVTPSREINPDVHVRAAQRPPMLWVDGGKIYALVGADVEEFGSGVEGAMNITVGGGKVYWTEMTGESSGTINSAKLDGSGVKELKKIKAVPMGIAVDTETGDKLYWTNSRGRIQSADLDGSGIENVWEDLPGPMDIAVARGNLYWTQYDATAGTGSVGIANATGRGTPKYIATGSDMPGSIAIGGNKVYWTEMTGSNAGTINSASLNGSGAEELNDIRAVPMGIGVDTARSKLYWTNSRGRIQSANLEGRKIQNVVDGLGNPGDMVLSNSIEAPVAGGTPSRSRTTDSNKYDVNGDGSVDGKDVDALIVAVAAGVTDAKYDVNGDGKVDIFDVSAVSSKRSDGAASAPALLGTKLSIVQIDRLQDQIDLLIASNDRSPDAMRLLIYLQQLIVMARPEKTQLLANYPNPFNPETWIPYELATDTTVKITIYNTQGVVIRTLELGYQSAGYYTGRDRAAYWDGRNALGEQVASGIYFYQFETDEMSSMRKMVILK